jgi:hypothetical protein
VLCYLLAREDPRLETVGRVAVNAASEFIAGMTELMTGARIRLPPYPVEDMGPEYAGNVSNPDPIDRPLDPYALKP